MKLLVFGNGFHRWLGLKTKYIHYKNFLIENKDKFENFFKILNEITKSCNDDKEWSSLEDDILCWLCKNINKTNPLNVVDVDIFKALNEKNISLREWIKQINKDYKSEIEQLQIFLKDRCPIIDNGAFIWTFNYMIDYYKPWRDNKYKYLRIQTKIYDDVNRRMVTQCHFFAYDESMQEIKLGANYKTLAEKVKNLDEIVKNDDKKCLIMVLTKFCPLSINNKCEKLNNPIQYVYEDYALNLPILLWTPKKQISEICFLGFSFGEQDDIYFSNEAKLNPLKYCNNFKYTYHKDDERDKIKEKLKKYDCNANISEYKMDELLKDIFGNDGYNELCKIQSYIDKKNKSTDK